MKEVNIFFIFKKRLTITFVRLEPAMLCSRIKSVNHAAITPNYILVRHTLFLIIV